jgi:2,4-dienoyl-CoA reductase-like NADH-dependent reductase (Old Yellow Enzyme family)
MNKIKFERLFSEFNIKNLSLKNRIVFLPHYTALGSIMGLPSEEEIYYYAERAKGGAGLIICGNYSISKKGQWHRTAVNVSDKGVIKNFRKQVKQVQKFGAKIIGQLNHAGSTKMENPAPDLYAPSQVIEKGLNSYTIEIDKDEISEVIKSFKKSAINLVESGFNGVEIKVAHDGLLRPFISPYYNKRVDEYGGSFRNKMRIIYEVFSSVKEVLTNEMILGVRLCLDEFDDEGYNLETGLKIAKYFDEKELADYINTDAGTWNPFIMEIPPMSIPLGFSEYMYAALKKEVNLPIIAFGRINDPVQAEQILENGSADLIGMARQLICDPETPKKAKKVAVDEIRKCIACNEGCVGQVMHNQPLRCIQNPSVGREKRYGIGRLGKTRSAKKIVVVGGGAAGLKFSEIAAKRGHNVILYEKNSILGGQINLLKKIPFRNEFSEVIRYLEFQIRKLNTITLKIPEKACKENILEENPDVIVIATGSELKIPENICNEKTITSWDLLNETSKIGKKIIIYDLLSKNEGMGAAEYLFEIYENINVRYFTPASGLGLYAKPDNLDIILRKLMPLDFEVIPYHTIKSANKEKIVFGKIYTEKEYIINDYDNLIVIGFVKSSDDLYWELKNNVKEVYRVGDAKSPSCVELAIRDAEEIARSI